VPSAVWAMLALGCLGSGVAYMLNFTVVGAAGGTTASTVTYLTPVVAVIAGAVFLSELLVWNQPLGAVNESGPALVTSSVGPCARR